MADRLFISDASEDAAVAERIVAYLEARGVPCWISSLAARQGVRDAQFHLTERNLGW